MYTIKQPEPMTVREQIANYGNIADMETKDLLATFFSVGSKANGESVTNKLLENHTVDQLASLDFGTLMSLGVSESKAVALLSVIELTKRSLKTKAERETILNSEQLAHRMMALMGSEKQEVLRVLYLNTQHEIIEERDIFKGSVNRSLANPREILYYACRNMASAVIVVHNHPSGNPHPSQNDESFTKNLNTVCEALGVVLLDHLVVSQFNYYSFQENGKM